VNQEDSEVDGMSLFLCADYYCVSYTVSVTLPVHEMLAL